MANTLALLVLVILVLWIAIAITISNIRFGRKLEDIRQVYLDLRRMRMQQQRAQRQKVVGQDPIAWLRTILPGGLPEENVTAKAFPRFDAVQVTYAGGTLVIARQPYKPLQRVVSGWAKGNNLKAMEEGVPLPSGKPKEVIEIGLDDTRPELAYFDEDAAAAGKTWGVNWGKPRSLYFMTF